MAANTGYCGIDYGTKRIGLSVGTARDRIASPLSVVDAQDTPETVVARILAAVQEYDVDEWVMGLPLNTDGTEGDQAKLVRSFGSELARISGRLVHYWDERFSSSTADDHMAMTGLTHKKKKARHDALAAQVILQSFLDAQA